MRHSDGGTRPDVLQAEIVVRSDVKQLSLVVRWRPGSSVEQRSLLKLAQLLVRVLTALQQACAVAQMLQSTPSTVVRVA